MHGAQRTEMPKEEDKWLYYKDVGKQHKVAYVGYADFEALGEPIKDYNQSNKTIYINKKAKHCATGFTFKWVSIDHQEEIDQITNKGTY